MSPSSYTELFFLDEVTALAAGHRPCYECQRQRALQFAESFATGNGLAHIRAGEMDRRLHGERLARGNTPDVVNAETVKMLPDGVMVACGSTCFATRSGQLLPWAHDGYGHAISVNADRPYAQLTPPSTVAAIKAGFTPWFHPRAR